MKKLVSLLLAMVLIFSLLPLSAMADTIEEKFYIKDTYTGKWYELVGNKPGPELTDKDLIASLDKSWNEYMAELEKSKDDDDEAYVPHSSSDKIIGYGSDTKYHWKQCSCGCKIGMELHVDPKDTTDDTCICGYHFSDNADLVTLWVKGCPGIKHFNKNTTEYKLNAYTYKDVKEIKISTRTHDSEATVELPEDLTLKEGENKFEVKVIAENQKVTKTYTLIITKEAAK